MRELELTKTEERAKQSYRRIAKNIFESTTLKEGSDNRLSRALKPSSIDYVHETGKIRLEDINGLGPSREKKIATIGIWDINDLYDEYENGHIKELLALQKDDNAFTPAVLAKAISTSPKMPEEDVGLGIVKVVTPDGTIEERRERFFFDIFKKEVNAKGLSPEKIKEEGLKLSTEEKQMKELLTDDQVEELRDKFKNSYSVEGIQKKLEDTKKAMKVTDIELIPFAIKKGDMVKGRRINEIEKYLELFGVDKNSDSKLTLEDQGAYLKRELIEKFRALGRKKPELAPIIRVGLVEVAPTGRKEKIEKSILGLVKKDLRPEANNTIKALLDRSKRVLKKLTNEDELAKIATKMVKEGTLKTDSIVAEVPLTNLYPSEDEIKKEIMKRRSVVIGTTANPRIPDYIDYIIRFPRESDKSYNKRLMEKSGHVVFENKPIVRDRMNLKVPIRGGKDFSDDINKAVQILGFSIKNGFAPKGYQYKDPEVVTNHNSFHVLVRPPSEFINTKNKPHDFSDEGDVFTFVVKKGTSFLPNLGLTNILKNDEGYVTSLCPPTADGLIKKNRAMMQGVAMGLDSIKLNRKVTGITDKDDGVMTAMCKLAKSISPTVKTDDGKILKFGDCRIWKEGDLATKIIATTKTPEFNKAKKKGAGRKLNILLNGYPDSDRYIKKRKNEGKRITTEMSHGYGDIVNELALYEKEAHELEVERDINAKNGVYIANRRIGCTAHKTIEDDGNVFIQVNKLSQAGKDIEKYLSSVCPTMEKTCVLENITIHQNLTDNIEGTKTPGILKRIYDSNPKPTDADLIDEALVVTRKKVFRSGERLEGGTKEDRRAIREMMMGSKHILSLEKWDFLDKL